MTEEEQIKDIVLSSKRAAAEDMAAIKECSELSREFLHEKLRAYILHKYLLTEEDCSHTDIFHDLTELSLSKSMKISKDLVKEFDLAKSCDGATSTMAKKVLLFLSIQKELGILLPARESATFKCVTELSQMVWNELGKQPQWQAKMV